jgi:hypothetical protein
LRLARLSKVGEAIADLVQGTPYLMKYASNSASPIANTIAIIVVMPLPKHKSPTLILG